MVSTASDYDARDRRTTITDAKGGVTTLGYDDRDNLITVTDPTQSTTTFTYDSSDRLITETRPEGETRHYTYYANGLRETETNGKGEITLYTYDDAGQLKKVQYYANATAKQNNTVGKTVDFDYNVLGLLSHYADGQTTGTYTYDVLGRLETVSVNYGPFSKSHSYTYNSDGRRKTYTNPEGVTYTYSYTANGDFQSLAIPSEGAIAVSAYKWRAPSEWLFPGGTRITSVTDGLLRPTNTSLLDPGANGKASRVYTYNKENHITGIATEEGQHNYTLDELYRLTAAAFAAETQLQDELYSYDGVGNRLTENGSEAWQYNANHQLETTPAATFEYDANGHTVSKTEGTTKTVYDYDITERMQAVRIDNGATLGQYLYDPFGRRVRKVTASGTLYFHYDDTGLLAEYDQSGNLISEYQYKPGSTWMTNPLFKRDGATQKVHYYHNSHLGQPLKLFDKSGKVTWAARSQAFGGTSVFVNEVENNLRFPGQYEDGESGLFYNFWRYYDAEVGRYLRSDPIGLAGGLNTYVYISANPLSDYDPYGLFGMADMPLAPQGLVDAVAGFGDTLGAGLIRDALDVDGGINKCSAAYLGGGVLGSLMGPAGRVGYIARVAKVPAQAAARGGSLGKQVERASRYRKRVKEYFRGGDSLPTWRKFLRGRDKRADARRAPKSLEGALSGSGRTNKAYNGGFAAAGGASAAGAAYRSQGDCDCE